MRNVIFLSGPMGNGNRPKKYFGATKELMRANLGKSSKSNTLATQKSAGKEVRTA